VAEEAAGENEVAQPVNAAANAIASLVTNAAGNTPGNAQNNTPPMLLAPNSRTLPATQDRTQELNLHQYKPTAFRAVNVNAYEMKWR
jgi:hypothetical protein